MWFDLDDKTWMKLIWIRFDWFVSVFLRGCSLIDLNRFQYHTSFWNKCIKWEKIIAIQKLIEVRLEVNFNKFTKYLSQTIAFANVCVCVWVGGGFAHIAKKTHHLDKQVHLPQFFPFAFLFGVMGPSSNTLNFKWMFHPINVSGVFSASWRKEFTGQRHKCLTLQQNRSRWRHSSPEINKMRWSQQMDDISWR